MLINKYIELGSIWQHYKNNKLYKVVGFPLFQDNDGKWIDGVVILYKDESDKLFIRKREEFLQKFKRIK